MTTITIDRAVVEQALEALNAMNPYPASKEEQRAAAITALRSALEQPQQEPVAWGCVDEDDGTLCGIFEYEQPPHYVVPLYTAPQAPRRLLKDEEIEDLYFDGFSISKLKDFARAIEARILGEQT